MSGYSFHNQVLSSYCDSTGVMQAPRMHELAAQVVETWFDEALDWSYARMLGGEGVSVLVVETTSKYPSASRIGDHLIWRLSVTRIGRTAMELALTARCGGDVRAEMTMAIVLSEQGAIQPRRWPDTIRARAADYLSNSEPA